MRSKSSNSRLFMVIGIGILVIIIIAVIAAGRDSKPSALSASAKSSSDQAASHTVPWDYKIDQAKVGDLIGGDMTILPNNQMLPNDDNYATGDTVYVLSFMNATMTAGADGKNDVKLSAWEPIKSYHTESAAKDDLARLKLELKTDVDLVGVYKTEYQGKFRQYALLTLPSGNTIKQPVDAARYASLKDKKQVKVVLEEVHDFADYDLAMSKFRGWAD